MSSELMLSSKDKEELQDLSNDGVTEVFDFSLDTIRNLPQVDQINCLLVTRDTVITDEALKIFKEVKAIGVYGTNTKNIHLGENLSKKIKVFNVSKYSDFETAECIVMRLLSLMRGLEVKKWKDKVWSLEGKKIGIIGLGHVGMELYKMCQAFQMDIYYTGRTQKNVKARFLSKEDLLQTCDIVSLHVPPQTMILNQKDFQMFQGDKILINTCVGEVYQKNDFLEWLKNDSHIALLDDVSLNSYEESKEFKNMIPFGVAAYKTEDSIQRLNTIFLNNLKQALI